MVWKEKYMLGVENIDNQHKELFSIVSRFLNVLRSDKLWQEKIKGVNETLLFMKNYVVEHFQDEEDYQKRIGYPDFKSHKKIHDDMVRYVIHISNEYEKEGFKEELMQQFGGKLLAWLINHVVADDYKIAEYSKKKEKEKCIPNF